MMFAVRTAKKRKKRTSKAVLLARAGTQTPGGGGGQIPAGLHLSRERAGMVQSYDPVEKPPLAQPRRSPCDGTAAAAAAPNRIYSSFAPLHPFPVQRVFVPPPPKCLTFSPS